MVTVISWWALDGCYNVLVSSGWLLLFSGGLWMVPDISWQANSNTGTVLNIVHYKIPPGMLLDCLN